MEWYATYLPKEGARGIVEVVPGLTLFFFVTHFLFFDAVPSGTNEDCFFSLFPLSKESTPAQITHALLKKHIHILKTHALLKFPTELQE